MLTKKQKEKIPAYIEKYRAISLDTSSVDEEQARKAVHEFYAWLNRKKPEVVFEDSPNAMIDRECALSGKKRSNFDKRRIAWPQFYVYWISGYTFVADHRDVDISDRAREGVRIANELAKHTHAFLMSDTHCIVSKKPIYIKRDGKKLHCEDGPAIEYADGYSQHYLWGVSMKGQEWVITNPESQNPLAIENAEQRLMALKKVGIENYLDSIEHKVIDTFQESFSMCLGDTVREKVINYELLLINLEGKLCEFLKMENPSSEEKHIEGVAPGIKTCQEALAWRKYAKNNVYTAPVGRA